MQVPEALQLGRVRTVPVWPRLEDRRQLLNGGVREERAETLAQLPFEDARVPIAVRAERRSGVVDVQAAQPVEADALVDLREGRGVHGRIGDVDP